MQITFILNIIIAFSIINIALYSLDTNIYEDAMYATNIGQAFQYTFKRTDYNAILWTYAGVIATGVLVGTFFNGYSLPTGTIIGGGIGGCIGFPLALLIFDRNVVYQGSLWGSLLLFCTPMAIDYFIFFLLLNRVNNDIAYIPLGISGIILFILIPPLSILGYYLWADYKPGKVINISYNDKNNDYKIACNILYINY